MASKARGHVSLMQDRVVRAAVDKGAPLTKAEQRQVRHDAMTEWRAMDDAERQRWHVVAKESAVVDQRSQCDATSSGYDCDVLWGVGDRKSPVRTEVIEELIKERLGVTRVGGLTSYAHVFRDDQRREAFVEDVRELPETESVDYTATCGQLHRGLCKDQKDYACLISLVRKVSLWCVQQKAEGHVVRFSALADKDAATPFAEVLAHVAYVRQADPRVVALARCVHAEVQGPTVAK